MLFRSGIFLGGAAGPPYVATNSIEYITISTTGNATDFGDCQSANYKMGGTSNDLNDRGFFLIGTRKMSYITISTLGNSVHFGDRGTERDHSAGITSNGTDERAVWAGGSSPRHNNIAYATISTLGNSRQFGNLTVDQSQSNMGGLS